MLLGLEENVLLLEENVPLGLEKDMLPGWNETKPLGLEEARDLEEHFDFYPTVLSSSSPSYLATTSLVSTPTRNLLLRRHRRPEAPTARPTVGIAWPDAAFCQMAHT